MKISVFIRFIEGDMQRGHILLAGFDKKLTRSSAARVISLSLINRDTIDKMVEEVRRYYDASVIIDATDLPLARKIQRLLGEKVTGKLLEVAEPDPIKV